MKCVYAYVRVSTVKQGERGSSLQEQCAAIEGYAKRHELLITEWFEEKETAAKRGRRVFNHMLRLLEKRKAVGVIIHKIDRSARNLRDWADLGELIDTGVEVHFAHESLDLHSRGGRLSADIQAVVAADYIRNLKDEVRKGFYGRLKQGFLPLPAPLGYQNNGGGQLKTLDPATAPPVRRAFELYATGRFNLDTLVDELYRLGLRNRRGGQLRRSALARILANDFYIGIIHLKRTNERFLGKHEPLISKFLFEEVQAVLQGRRKHRGLKYDFPYRKTFRCAHCGYSLIGEMQKGHRYYRCHSRSCPRTCLREEEIENQIQALLNKLCIAPEDYPLLADEFERCDRETMGERESFMRGLGLRLKQFDDRLARLTDAYVDRLIEKETFEDRKRLLFLDRTEVQEELDRLTSGEHPVTTRAKQFLELVRRLSQAENLMLPQEKLDLLKSATSNLQMDRDFLSVSWKIPFNVLTDRSKTTCGGPYRTVRRTHGSASERPVASRIHLGTSSAKCARATQFARHLYRLIYDDVRNQASSAKKPYIAIE